MKYVFYNSLTMSEGENSGWKVPLPSWIRKGRKADLTKVPVSKLQKAAEERGVRVDDLKREGGKVTGNVNKVIIKGDDEL